MKRKKKIRNCQQPSKKVERWIDDKIKIKNERPLGLQGKSSSSTYRVSQRHKMKESHIPYHDNSIHDDVDDDHYYYYCCGGDGGYWNGCHSCRWWEQQ
jgi:hypothetical protein